MTLSDNALEADVAVAAAVEVFDEVAFDEAAGLDDPDADAVIDALDPTGARVGSAITMDEAPD